MSRSCLSTGNVIEVEDPLNGKGNLDLTLEKGEVATRVGNAWKIDQADVVDVCHLNHLRGCWTFTETTACAFQPPTNHRGRTVPSPNASCVGSGDEIHCTVVTGLQEVRSAHRA